MLISLEHGHKQHNNAKNYIVKRQLHVCAQGRSHSVAFQPELALINYVSADDNFIKNSMWPPLNHLTSKASRESA
jgi:hypothetical protein